MKTRPSLESLLLAAGVLCTTLVYTAVPGVTGNSVDVTIDGTQRCFRLQQ